MILFRLPLFLAAVALLAFPLAAQKGEYYLTHYAPDDDQIENENYAIAENRNGEMLFANKKGILTFDGRKWHVNKTPSTVLSLASDKKTGIIYAGCLDDFGYIKVDGNGNNGYISLFSSGNKFISISKIVVTGSYVYFKGASCLFEYSKALNKITRKWNYPHGEEFEIFACNDVVFLSDKKKGILKVENHKLITVPARLPYGEKVVFSAAGHKNTIFAATDQNHYYLFDGALFKPVALIDAEYLKSSMATDAVWVRDDLLIIATAKGGCVLVNPVTWKTISIMNFYSGLPDNEVLAIGCDKQYGVWIAHEYGFTRLNYNLPLRNFTNYPGLEGNITATTFYHDKIYVSTNEGLYYLDQIKDYKEVTKYVRIKIAKKELVNEPQKRGFIVAFTKLFTGKKREPKQNAAAREKNQKAAQPQEQIKVVTNFELQSVKYVYKKIKGLEVKCRQLLPFNGKLLVASNKGIFEINNKDVVRLISDDISYLYISNDRSRFFAGTNDNKLIVYNYDGQKWIPGDLANLPETVFNITEDKNGYIWVSLQNSILKYSPSLSHMEDFKIKNPYSDDIHLINGSDKLYAFIGSNAYFFDTKNNTLVKDDHIIEKTNTSVHFIHVDNNTLWYHNGQQWNHVSDRLKETKNLVYLRLLEDIHKVFYDKQKNICFIVTKDNGLYHLDLSAAARIENVWNLFLRSVKDNDGNNLEINKIQLKQNSGNVSFSFVRPEYLESKSQQYSYKLTGFYDKWSAWSYENDITFGYLPSGSYTLVVRTKNALNQITESKPLLFEVKPPYWQEWWFYLGEFMFFASLLGASIWLNGSDKKNQWITRGLTFLTIVMMIELVNTLFDSFLVVKDSPVLSFLVQVLLAILIFPFERILAILITRDHKMAIFKLMARIRRALLFRKISKGHEKPVYKSPALI